MRGLVERERERDRERQRENWSFIFIFIFISMILFLSLDSPETVSLVTAGEEENNPIIDTGIRHTYHQCKIPQPHFAVHLQNCIIIVILTLFQT
jgi:hypothetical protein